MRTRRMAVLLAAGGLAAGLGAGMTGMAHASDPTRLGPAMTGIARASAPTRPGEAWNEIFLPFGNGKGSSMCVGVPGGSTAVRHGHAGDGQGGCLGGHGAGSRSTAPSGRGRTRRW